MLWHRDAQMVRSWSDAQVMFWVTQVADLEPADARKVAEWMLGIHAPWAPMAAAVRLLRLTARDEATLLFAVSTEHWEGPFEDADDPC